MKALTTMMLICGSIFIFSCSEEDDSIEINNSGKLNIKGVEHELKSGIIWDRIDDPGSQVYNFDIDLIGGEMDAVAESGDGYIVAMELYTDRMDDLAPGTYNHSVNAYPAGTFGGNIVFGNLETEEITFWYITTGGTIEVNKSGAVYELDMEIIADEFDPTPEFDFIKTDSNVMISCQYKGTLERRLEVID